MSQFLLIERIQVQNANAASGFTWGFPAITHFLGFAHNLTRKLKTQAEFSEVSLGGCAVIAHDQHVHGYKESSNNRFSQYKTAHYLGLTFVGGRLRDPAINEEAKMNMTVSMLIPISGYLGGIYEQEQLIKFVTKACLIQRLAGGTILNIENIEIVDLTAKENLRPIRNNLLPGFVLQDRSNYLAEHLAQLQQQNPEAELLDAWFDFIALKQIARPDCELIDKYLAEQAKNSEELNDLNEAWLEHKSQPYQINNLPEAISSYFSKHEESLPKNLIHQWQEYQTPTNKTPAEWEYVKKPRAGFLVPIMTGYKAITEVFPAGEIEGSRDIETNLCFVEAVHSIGEWQSVHRLKELQDWQDSVWNYKYEKDWYLCQQGIEPAQQDFSNNESVYIN